MDSSKRLRENIQQTMAQSSSDLVAQRNATDFAIRRRIHETEQARDELEWQKKQVFENFRKFSFTFE
jgi:tektin-2